MHRMLKNEHKNSIISATNEESTKGTRQWLLAVFKQKQSNIIPPLQYNRLFNLTNWPNFCKKYKTEDKSLHHPLFCNEGSKT